MVSISLINPLDQPAGRSRLLNHLFAGLQDRHFTSFRFVVAFAKVGPLLRMKTTIDASRAAGLKIEAIFGVDQQGTSAQALQFALDNFDAVYVIREPNLTFHPKMYAFEGATSARLFVGSNNLTVGGTETNFETAIRLDLKLPQDAATFKLFADCWKELMPAVCPATKKLTDPILADLILDTTVPDETLMRRVAAAATKAQPAPRAPRSGLKTRPASPLPQRKAAKAATAAIMPASTATTTPVTNVVAGPATKSSTSSALEPFAAQGLAMQINPHDNGEIFLSVNAALQNPAFFGWPFNGFTVPKKGSNTAYPQLSPDPRVKITVYGAAIAPLLELPDYALNTVYYERNSEICITASPLVGVVPEYSVMIMRKSDAPELDYEITIHTPTSSDYAAWVAACNQTMPSGGKSIARKFGWF